jgi:hypothetical protein
MASKSLIVPEKKSQRLSNDIASIGVDEVCIFFELLVGPLIHSETKGHQFDFSLWVDSRSGLSLSHS